MASSDQTTYGAASAKRWKAQGFTTLLWVFSLLFAGRVSGQALQCLAPQTWLPSFHAFQGSNLPYWLLLPVQLLILASMTNISLRAQNGTITPSRQACRALGWAGGLYMAVALGRIAVGLSLPAGPHWYRAWIPAAFHVVLAGFVLTLSAFHRTASKAALEESRS